MERIATEQDYVVCVKPVGISSEDGPDSMPALLRQELGGEIFPVHRLDLNVGGVMVYARTKSAAAKLSQAVQEGVVVKEYLAVTHGVPELSEGIYEDLLWKGSRKNKVFVVKVAVWAAMPSMPSVSLVTSWRTTPMRCRC